MDVTIYLEALRSDMDAASDSGDPPEAAAVVKLGRVLEASLRLRLLDALSEAAAELSAQLPAGRAEVRLAGQEVSLVFVGDQVADEPPVPHEEGGETARITLRLGERLKSRAEAAAAREGVSLNAWLTRAVARAVDAGPVHKSGRRLRGFAQS
jgi:hypothetical protein